MRIVRILYATLLAGALGAGCDGCKKTARRRRSGGSGGAATATGPQLLPIGMADPFAPPKNDAAKLHRDRLRGAASRRSRRWRSPRCKTSSTDAPDWTPARWALVRALVMGERWDDALKQWEELLARDFVGVRRQARQGQRARQAAHAAAVAEVRGAAGALSRGLRRGLDKGFFFVARTRSAAEPQFAAGVTEAPLSLRQEVFHYDPDGKRFRRVSDTDGRAFAIDRSPDGKSLLFLVAPQAAPRKRRSTRSSIRASACSI